jgi:hypothetical protein
MLEYKNKDYKPESRLPILEIAKNVIFVVVVFAVFILFLRIL